MGKAEVGTPKYLANKMKAKGLQKLRWYCQMCEKQCRDENGFKCHTQSESHQRQLLLFADNSKRYMDDFSKQFANDYLELLKRQFGTKRVNANRVYQEYIADRNHLHMNSTKWVTLTAFVKWLGREGHCVVDETEKGWYVTYIDRSPETIAFQERMAKKEKMAKDDEEKMEKFIRKQIKLGKKLASQNTLSESNNETKQSSNEDFISNENREKIKLSLSSKNPMTKLISSKNIDDKSLPSTSKDDKRKKSASEDGEKTLKKLKIESNKPKSALDEIIELDEKNREKRNRKDYWLTENIVVKVVTKSLGDEYYGKKGVIREVLDKYICIVSLFETKKKLKLDQAHLETVIPAIGRYVKVLNGAYRGETATLVNVNEESFSVSLEIQSGTFKGRLIKHIPYEDISKLNTS